MKRLRAWLASLDNAQVSCLLAWIAWNCATAWFTGIAFPLVHQKRPRFLVAYFLFLGTTLLAGYLFGWLAFRRAQRRSLKLRESISAHVEKAAAFDIQTTGNPRNGGTFVAVPLVITRTVGLGSKHGEA